MLRQSNAGFKNHLSKCCLSFLGSLRAYVHVHYLTRGIPTAADGLSTSIHCKVKQEFRDIWLMSPECSKQRLKQ